MAQFLRVSGGLALAIVSVFFASVSSPNYTFVLGVSAASGSVSLVLLAFSARAARGIQRLLLTCASALVGILAMSFLLDFASMLATSPTGVPLDPEIELKLHPTSEPVMVIPSDLYAFVEREAGCSLLTTDRVWRESR